MLCVLREGKQVRTRDLPDPVQHATSSQDHPPPPHSSQLVVDLDQPLDRTVLQVVSAALRLESGNQSRAAERLGVSVRTIQRYAARGLIPGGGRRRR